MGRRLTRKERRARRKFKLLIKKIRRTKTYLRWKKRVLRRDVPSYPKIPKGVQVHHRIELSKLLILNEVKTVRQALDCSELWESSLGICLKRGEHFIFTKLSRYRYLTKGFIEVLNHWMARCEIDQLDANKKRRRKK